MVTFQIPILKDFMSKLLIGDMFHRLLVKEISITTFNTFTIDGRLQKSFYGGNEAEAKYLSGQEFSSWKDLQEFCFALIKGKNLPLQFKMILCFNQEDQTQFLLQNKLDTWQNSIQGLYINIHFNGKDLFSTSGISYSTFQMDKTVEFVWDEYLMQFFKRNEIVIHTL